MPDLVTSLRFEPDKVIPLTLVAFDKSTVLVFPSSRTRFMLLILNSGVLSLTFPMSSTLALELMLWISFFIP